MANKPKRTPLPPDYLQHKFDDIPCKNCGHLGCCHRKELPSPCVSGRTNASELRRDAPAYGCTCMGYTPSSDSGISECRNDWQGTSDEARLALKKQLQSVAEIIDTAAVLKWVDKIVALSIHEDTAAREEREKRLSEALIQIRIIAMHTDPYRKSEREVVSLCDAALTRGRNGN